MDIRPPDPGAIAATTVAAAGYPLYGEFAIIIFAALVGALVSWSRQPKPEVERRKWHTFNYLFRGVAIASFTTGAAASWLSSRTGVDWYRAVACVAFLIALVGDGWFKVIDKLLVERFKPKD